MLKELFTLSILAHVVFCRFTPEEREWQEGDARQYCAELCTEECLTCTEPVKCTDLEDKCSEIKSEVHPDCPPSETCVPTGCQCR